MAKSSNDEIYDINLVPFIDVVLVLLICFMIVAPVAFQSGIRVSLPSAKSGSKLEKVTLRFVLNSSGQVFANGKVVSTENIRQLVLEAMKQDPTTDAVVAADSTLSHGQVLAFIDELRTQGLKSVALGVKPKDL